MFFLITLQLVTDTYMEYFYEKLTEKQTNFLFRLNHRCIYTGEVYAKNFHTHMLLYRFLVCIFNTKVVLVSVYNLYPFTPPPFPFQCTHATHFIKGIFYPRLHKMKVKNN